MIKKTIKENKKNEVKTENKISETKKNEIKTDNEKALGEKRKDMAAMNIYSKNISNGYIPGILMGLGCMFVSYIVARKNNYPIADKYSLKEAIARGIPYIIVSKALRLP